MNINRAKNGFIKLHYAIEDSDLSGDINAFLVFIRMLWMAHYEDDFTSIRFNGKQYHLKRGEFAASQRELSAYFNIPKSTLKNVIKRLELDSRLDTRTDHQITIFRICNYSKYQDKPTLKLTNDMANDLTNDMSNVTEGKQNIQSIKNNSNVEVTVELQKQLQRVYELSCKVFEKNPNQFKLTDKRRKKLKARLKDIGEERMGLALRTLADSPFHRGDNDRGWEADPDWLFNSFEKTEEWANKGQSQSPTSNKKLSELEF